MCDEKKEALNEKLTEKCLALEEEIDTLKDTLGVWTDAITELSEIEAAFKTNENIDFQNKTILDIGTDAVKPFYIALKCKPAKIIGIDEDNFSEFKLEVESRSKNLTETKISFYSCSLFDDIALATIRQKEGITGKFNFVLTSKTLHHLRTAKCVIEHECPEDESSCKYGFDTGFIFDKLLSLGERVIIYEPIETDSESGDVDRIRGRGGNFTKNEFLQIFKYLSENTQYRTTLLRPEIVELKKEKFEKVEAMVRQVDLVCFYVEG